MKFAFIAAEKATFHVSLPCPTLGASRPGFYASQARPPAPRHGADERLGLEIATIHAESRRRYGSPRIHAELGACGYLTSRKRVPRLIRARGLAARRRRQFRVTTDPRHPFAIAPNVLARQFERGHAGPGVGHRYHLHPDGRGLVVPRRDRGPLLALRRRLGHE